MKTGEHIRFEEDNKPYTIKAMNKRYLICVRPHTVAEREEEIKKWQEGLGERMSHAESEDEADYVHCSYLLNNGDCLDPISDDTFAYTIVDLKERIRGADNYGCKYDYDQASQCQAALKQLGKKTAEFSISRRNRVPLKILTDDAVKQESRNE